ncbi:MAG TPA: indolepyruvate ferredoxin oxidoreductase subunit alpha [Anaerovoracaceae bacterium]|nr:indolepyruvate ferredoxin oxidoreductase subunit alpha [Anaerovoracaceae bacterium]
MKQLMTGNEAIARGAYEAGVLFASAYPGTPSTEILENLSKYRDELYCEWAPNEKVALEAAIGASIAGVRSLSAMKHVGVNVAADPLFTLVYTGVTGGCVLVSADDPGMHSSQNEQDNRNYATAAKIPMLEPSDSSEAKEFTKLAFSLSEKFDIPFMLRVTTRICHSKSLVKLSEREKIDPIPYERNITKYVATPANGRALRRTLEDRLEALREYSNSAKINVAEYNGEEVGVICSGVAYQYAKEVFGKDASYLKLGMTYPMPMDLIREFSTKVKTVYVIEEMDPYMEDKIKAAGIDCIGKEIIPKYDELNTDIVRRAVEGIEKETTVSDMKAVIRPPTLCAGCPHRGFFYTISKKKNVMVTGDIGCYTLGSAPPLSSMDTCFCMGGSISAGHGASTAFRLIDSDTKVVAVIGDSTFFHSGITSLMDTVYNKGNCVTVILDNRTTGMTGHQENPGTGYTLMGQQTVEANIPLLCKAIGIKDENIYVVNPLKLKETNEVLNEALEKQEPTVIIAAWPCAIKKFNEDDKTRFDLTPKQCIIDQEKCTQCKLCVRTGCPAILSEDRITILPESCTGCSVCMQVCPFSAISFVD